MITLEKIVGYDNSVELVDKVVNNIVVGGFTKDDFKKIAEAIEFLGKNDIGYNLIR